MKRPNALVVFVGAAALLAMTACGSHETSNDGEPTGQPVPVRVSPVKIRSVDVARTAIGTVEPWRKATLATRIMGRIEKLSVVEGQAVKAGQVVALVDVADINAKIAQAAAAVEEAQARDRNAELQFDRMRNLLERGSATQREFDNTETELLSARARLAAARSMRKEAEAAKEYGRIAAPFAGVVTAKLAEQGDIAAPGQPLLAMQDQSKVKVVVQVPEREMSLIRKGMGLSFLAEASTRSAGEGTVEEIVPTADNVSRTFEVKLTVDNGDRAFRPGMFVQVSIPLGAHEVLTVPRDAIHRKGQLSGVFLAGPDGKARLTWIKTGRIHDGSVEVVSGLEQDDPLVVWSERPLHDGQALAVLHAGVTP